MKISVECNVLDIKTLSRIPAEHAEAALSKHLYLISLESALFV